MGKLNDVAEKWNGFYQKIKPSLDKGVAVCHKIGEVCGRIADWIIKFRKVILTVPVAFASVCLAIVNAKNLPETVGINLLENGEYAYLVSSGVAVFGPLAVTALCLLLMMCSRKTLYPWIISVFSLALPLIILLTNNFPA